MYRLAISLNSSYPHCVESASDIHRALSVAGTKQAETSVEQDTSLNDVKFDGNLEYVHQYGGNESKPSCQEASGASVETISPLGLQVTWFTTIFLNVGQMIGTGVFSTSKLYFRI